MGKRAPRRWGTDAACETTRVLLAVDPAERAGLMLLVPCPHCGPRNAADFRYVGESRSRPDPNSASPREWRAYLYERANPAGILRETWYCRAGCRRFFTLERDTATNEFTNPPMPVTEIGKIP